MFKILYIANIPREVKVVQSKNLLKRLFKLIEICKVDLLYYPVTALFTFYLEDSVEQELV